MSEDLHVAATVHACSVFMVVESCKIGQKLLWAAFSAIQLTNVHGIFSPCDQLCLPKVAPCWDQVSQLVSLLVRIAK